jgi:hypothetical protein
LVFVLVSAGPALAGTVSIGVSAALAFPMGPFDFKDGYRPGPGWGLSVGLEAAPRLEAVLELNQHVFPLERSYFFNAAGVPDDGASALEGGKTTARLALFSMRVRPCLARGKWGPYLIGGLGLAGFRVAKTRGTTPEWVVEAPGYQENDLAVRAGVGLDLRLDPETAFFLQGDWVAIMTLGGSTTAGMLRAGLKYFL